MAINPTFEDLQRLAHEGIPEIDVGEYVDGPDQSAMLESAVRAIHSLVDLIDASMAPALLLVPRTVRSGIEERVQAVRDSVAEIDAAMSPAPQTAIDGVPQQSEQEDTGTTAVDGPLVASDPAVDDGDPAEEETMTGEPEVDADVQ